jgi:hypothetical protein
MPVMTIRLKTSFLAFTIAVLAAACAKKPAVVDSGTPETKDAGSKSASTKTGTPEAPPGDSIPGESDVHTAMMNKDYSGAVERLTAIKSLAVTPEQINAYNTLYGNVRDMLNDASRTDPKAAEALAALRFARNGR